MSKLPSPLQQNVVAIVPALNEELHIERVVSDALKHVEHVIVIDDASQDMTHELASSFSKHKVTVLQNRTNLGVGASLRRGYRHALTMGMQHAVVLAGDGQMNAKQIPAFIAVANQGAAYVKGNRFAHPSAKRMPILRRWGSSFFAMITSWLINQKINDAQCGYTLATRDAMSAIVTRSKRDGYGYPNEFLYRLWQADLLISEVPAEAIYADERSNLRISHALVSIPWLLLRLFVEKALWMRNRQAAKENRAFTTTDSGS